MDTLSFSEFLLAILVSVVVGFFTVAYFVSRGIRKQVEEALKDATTEEQAIIRNKVVKAVFPPRFPRD